MTLPEFQQTIRALHLWAENGCGDGGCVIKKPSGMVTNGGCRCRPQDFTSALLDIGLDVEKLGRRNWKPV